MKQFFIIRQNSKAEQFSILQYGKGGPVRRSWSEVTQAFPDCLTDKAVCPWGASLWEEGENGAMQCVASNYDSGD
jgi:hypothetical protein